MYKTQLLKDYQALSPAGKRYMVEFYQTKAYICSDLKDELCKLAEFLLDQRSFTPRSVDQKRAFKYVFGREDFDEGKFERLMSCFHEAMWYAREK
jgi:hypothetical protein